MQREQFDQIIKEVAEIISVTPPDMEKLQLCENKLEFLLMHDRQNPWLIFMMGSVYAKMGRWAMAEHWLSSAMHHLPDQPEMKNQLGFICQQEGRIDEALEHYESAFKISPDNSEVANNLASILVNNGTPDKAIEACEAAIKIDPDKPDPHWNKALAQLELGNWKDGWKNYEYGLLLSGMNSYRKNRRYPTNIKYWEGTAGKSVVVYGEQGVGDEIMASSMLPDLMKDCDVMVEAHPRLVTLFRRAWGDKISIYGSRKSDVKELPWTNWAKPQTKLPVMSLGKHYRNHDDAFPKTPYLCALDEQREDAADFVRTLGERPRIGFSWQGGTLPTRSDIRTMPLPLWKGLLKSVDATWVSLQYDPAEQPGMWSPIIKQFNEWAGVQVHHNQIWNNDLDMCYGGLIHELDLIISINTSLVHACGAMGVPCWTLTPSRPAWRYGLTGSSMPFYGDWIRVMRQKDGNWLDLLEQVKTELTDIYGVRSAA
jgi:tetratricopeptide (TPR) repeat protein